MCKQYVYFLMILFVVLILFALIPHDFLDSLFPEVDWKQGVQTTIGISMFVILAWLFKKVGYKSKKLENWIANTYLGTMLMIVAFLCLLVFSVDAFLLIPVHGAILLLYSLVVAIFAIILFFEMASENGV